MLPGSRTFGMMTRFGERVGGKADMVEKLEDVKADWGQCDF